MSKQLKAKKPSATRVKRPSRSELMHPASAVSVSTPHATSDVQAIDAFEHISHEIDVRLDESPEELTVTEDPITPDHVMSTMTTASVASTKIQSVHEIQKQAGPQVMFDDEVLHALAQADADAHEREEEAFRAIMRAVSS